MELDSLHFSQAPGGADAAGPETINILKASTVPSVGNTAVNRGEDKAIT